MALNRTPNTTDLRITSGATADATAPRAPLSGAFAQLQAKLVEAKNDTLAALSKLLARASEAKVDAVAKATSALDGLKVKLLDAAACTKKRAFELTADAKSAARNPKLQVTAASAAGGAVTLGAAGGTVGLATGSAVGAALGVIPALFTFGLSIPIGAALGGGAGLCAGTAIGGAAGMASGGVAGYGAYEKRTQIQEGVSGIRVKAGGYADSVKEKMNSSAKFMRARLNAGTGGSA